MICGDAFRVLRDFPSGFVDCAITSPPYWALRDYGMKGQLGQEKTFAEYIDKLCNIFDEVRRILKKSGTCWVNLGDSYGGFQGKNAGWPDSKTKAPIPQYQKPKQFSKCLLNIPHRVAIEMVNRGWILRNTVIWHKPNCMPSSVKDRFTVDFEYMFFFTKNKKYYFETQYEPVKQCSIERLNRAVSNKHKWVNGPDGQTQHTMNKPRPNRNYKRYEKSNAPHEFKGADHLVSPFDPKKGRNKRCVWTISTKPFKEAHFAVFPEELVETPIKAGCPKGGIVLDPFSGAGTTLLVAKKLGRNFIGIDIKPEFVKMSTERVKSCSINSL